MEYIEISLVKSIVSYLTAYYGSLNSRCTCIAWVPNGDGTFIVGHADGNMYAYEKVSSRLFDMNRCIPLNILSLEVLIF